jgi:CDP-glycerol glycerophosphotransferase (TagB/SpsB family)
MNITFIKIIRILTLPLFFLLSIVSLIFPKDKSLWVFGAWHGERYSDNSRYLFEYVCMNEPKIKAVWLTRNKKVLNEIKKNRKEAYLVKSIKGFWIALRAKIVFVSSEMMDVNPIICHGAVKVQLWHGTPLKKIGLDDKISGNPEIHEFYKVIKSIWRRLLFFSFPKYDIIISPSPPIKEIFSSAFGVKRDKVILTGYPRNDIILRSNPSRVKKLDELKNEWGAKKIILYAPTFRNDNKKSNLFRGLDKERLYQLLINNNAAFLIKMHYVQRDQEVLSNTEINRYHMHLFSEEEAPDINLLLPYTDILITDYSSVYFDFLLLNKPIIFTPFDIEKYINADREFYEDYNMATPGPKCKNWNSVIIALEHIFKDMDDYKSLRREKLEIYNTFVDLCNCERIVKKINSIFYQR